MTKKEFCRQIVQTVRNCESLDSMNDDEIAKALEGLIAPLAPKDINRFAAWGNPEHQTTPNNCWD